MNQSNIFNEVTTREQFENLSKTFHSGVVSFIDMEDQSYIEIKFDQPILAKYVLLSRDFLDFFSFFFFFIINLF